MLFLRHAVKWLMRCVTVVLITCFSLAAVANGVDVVSPLFKSYSVPLRKIIKFAPTKIPSSDDPNSGINWKQEEYLRYSSKAPLNFSDKYTLFKTGCGTDCLEFCLIDRTTGVVYPGMSFNQLFPPDYKGHKGFKFHRSSRLLVVYHAGLGEPVFVDYYVWDGVKFILLKTKKIHE